MKKEKFRPILITTKKEYKAVTLDGRISVIPKGQSCILKEVNGVKIIVTNDGQRADWQED